MLRNLGSDGTDMSAQVLQWYTQRNLEVTPIHPVRSRVPKLRHTCCETVADLALGVCATRDSRSRSNSKASIP